MNSLTELVSGMVDSGSCWLCSGDFPSGRGRECIEDKGLWLGDWWRSETCKVYLKQDHLQPGSRQASHLAWSIVYSLVKGEWFWTPSLPKLLWGLSDILCVFSMLPGLSSIVCDYHAPPTLYSLLSSFHSFRGLLISCTFDLWSFAVLLHIQQWAPWKQCLCPVVFMRTSVHD